MTDERPEDDGAEAEPAPSFFAARFAECHRPWPVPGGEGLTIPVPDDSTVAELDDCEGALDVLETFCGPGEDGEELFESVCDALDSAHTGPVDAALAMLEHFRLDRPPEPVGWWGLVERINLYGGGIEFDLWDRGHDLGAYFRGEHPGGWDHLLRMIERLPQGSHYRAAMADDDELARRTLERYGPDHKKSPPRPPLAGFDQSMAYLHKIDFRLTYLAWAVFAAQAGKKKGTPPRPEKGPETAQERVDFEDFLREHDEIVSQVLKHKGGSKNRAAADLPPALGADDEGEGDHG